MSMAAIRWAYEQPIKPGSKAVLVCLAFHARQKDWRAWPGGKTIERETGFEECAVARHLAYLEERGLIRRERRYDHNKRRCADAFQLRSFDAALTGKSPDSMTGKSPDKEADPDRHSEESYPAFCGKLTGVLPPVLKKNPEEPRRTQKYVLPDSKKVAGSGKKKTQTKKNLISMPDDWPSEAERVEAVDYWRSKNRPDLAADIEHHAVQARDHHLAKGSRFVDWRAAWRTWVRNAMKFNRAPQDSAGAPQRRNSRSSAYVEAVQELMEEFDAER